MEVLATAIREEKDIQVIQIRKQEAKFSLFAHDMILYIGKPRDIRKLLELISKLTKITGYKIDTQKFLVFLYFRSEKTERDIKETIPLNIAMKRIKHF